MSEQNWAKVTLAELPLRPELKGTEPYGAPQLNVPVALNVNENPYPPTEQVRQQMSQAIYQLSGELNRYPEREAWQLRQALAGYLDFDLGPENIWVANGSNEIMTHLLLAFGGPGRKLLNFVPSYSMYPEYARDTHTEYCTAERDSDYQLSAGAILAAIEANQADIVLLCTPNNPTGTQLDLAVIDQVCANTDALVIVDEAYQEFTAQPRESALKLLPNYPRLVVSRTMSKAFALAGGRVGYLAGHPAVVDACRIVRLPYHLGAQTQAIAQVALANADQMLANVALLRQNCQELQSWLASQGFDVVPSQANFCLFGRFADRHKVWQGLLDQGVLIRETGPQGYLRVSAGTSAELDAFKDALLKLKDQVEMLN